jgi:hypothetical protein
MEVKIQSYGFARRTTSSKARASKAFGDACSSEQVNAMAVIGQPTSDTLGSLRVARDGESQSRLANNRRRKLIASPTPRKIQD